MGSYYSCCDINNCNQKNFSTYDDLEFNALCSRDYTYNEPLWENYSDDDTHVFLAVIDD